MTSQQRLAFFVAAAAFVITAAVPRGQGAQTNAGPADVPASRTDQNSLTAHEQLIEKARAGGIDVYFEGDSIARRWGATDYPAYLANWKQNFFGWNAADFAWGADKTQNILWRLDHGELDGVNPKVIVLLAGTNNVGTVPGDVAKVAEITRGLQLIVDRFRAKAPGATIILTAIFPRNDSLAVLPEIAAINANLARMADGKRVRYLNVNDKLADKDGKLFDGLMNADKLHPSLPGYQVWADALKPIFRELLGPPASTDHAPPPTGDPSARGRIGASLPTAARTPPQTPRTRRRKAASAAVCPARLLSSRASASAAGVSWGNATLVGISRYRPSAKPKK